MEVWSRRRGVVEICPKKEYLEEILREMREKRRISEMKNDKFFDRICGELQSQFRLVRGDEPSLLFKFNLDGTKHHRGHEYSYITTTGLFELVPDVKVVVDGYGRSFLKEATSVTIPSLDSLKVDDILEAINFLLVTDIMST